MRGTPTGNTRHGSCFLCLSPVEEIEQRAQHVTWWIPEPHDALCGAPCIGGGVEPRRPIAPGASGFEHAHRENSCGFGACRGGAGCQVDGLHPSVAWRVDLTDGSSRRVQVFYYDGPSAERCWFAEFGANGRARSIVSDYDAVVELARGEGWPFVRCVLPNEMPVHRPFAEVLDGLRATPDAFGATSECLSAWARGALACAAPGRSVKAWSLALAAVVGHASSNEPDWSVVSKAQVADIAEHAARALGLLGTMSQLCKTCGCGCGALVDSRDELSDVCRAALEPGGLRLACERLEARVSVLELALEDAQQQLSGKYNLTTAGSSASVSRYCPVFLYTDPFLGSRIVIGVLVQHEDEVIFVESTRLPGAEYLGKDAVLLAHALRALRQTKVFERKPIGPTVVFGRVSNLAGLRDPIGWVRKVFDE